MRLAENESRQVGTRFEAQVELSLKRSGMGLTLVDSETQVSEAKRAEICRANYPLCEAHRDIPQSGGY
jgi:hypothetical protein